MTYATQQVERLSFGDTVLCHVPSWAHTDGEAAQRMAVVMEDLGTFIKVALTSTTNIRRGREERLLRPRIKGDGVGKGNSLKTTSEVVLEPDGRLLLDRSDVVPKRTNSYCSLKRGSLSRVDKEFIKAHLPFCGVGYSPAALA